ncbi:hypothetical protein MRX96_040184 [Rhipicephalus microplus]
MEQADGSVVEEAPIAMNILRVNNAPQYEDSAKNCNGSCYQAKADIKVGSPSAVRNLTVTQTVPGEVVYSWQRPITPNGPLDGYIVTTGNLETTKVLITEVPGNATELVQKTIEQYTGYKVDVQAYNILGPLRAQEGWSCGQVSNFTALVKDQYLQSRSLETPSSMRKTAVNITVKKTSVWLECLETWHSYTALVSSCTASDTCGPPKKLYFQTDVGAPDMPRNLTSTSVTRYGMKLSWNSPEQVRGPLDGYKITFANSSNAFNVITKDTQITTKEGPAAAIQVRTLYGPKTASPWLSVTTITLMVVVPVVCFVVLSVYVVYKQLLKKREDEELLASSQS